MPTSDPDASEAFHRQPQFTIVSDRGHHRIRDDGRRWHLHPTNAAGWAEEGRGPSLYLHVDDVGAVTDAVRELSIEEGTPRAKPWGTDQSTVSDPRGLLVRVGCPIG